MPADACEINQNREWTEEAGGRLKTMRKEEKLSWEQAYFCVMYIYRNYTVALPDQEMNRSDFLDAGYIFPSASLSIVLLLQGIQN